MDGRRNIKKNSMCFGQIYCPSSGALILYSQQLVFVIGVMLTVNTVLRLLMMESKPVRIIIYL